MGFDNLEDMNRVISVEEAETEKAFQKLLINFLYNEPFFASIIASLDKVKTRSIQNLNNNRFSLWLCG